MPPAAAKPAFGPRQAAWETTNSTAGPGTKHRTVSTTKKASHVSNDMGKPKPKARPLKSRSARVKADSLARPSDGDAQQPLPEPFSAWFASRGWSPRPHQLARAAAAARGESALLIAPTGGGKTLAGFLPSLISLNAEIEAWKKT